MSFLMSGAIIAGAAISVDSANEASKRASADAKKSLAFEKQKYQDWQDTYGSLEDNLSAYYNKMTPDTYAAKGISEFNKQNEVALENVRTSLAQRGMLDSGIGAAVTLQSELAGAEKRATIRSTAEDVVATEKKGFLQIGLGQNPGQSYSAALAQTAQNSARIAANAEADASQAIGSAISTIGKAYVDYSRNKPTTPGA